MSDSANATGDSGRLLAWMALVAASALLIIGVKMIYDVPDDVRYRFSTLVFAVVVSGLQLAVVLRFYGCSRPPAARATDARRRLTLSVAISTLVVGPSPPACSRA